MTMPALFTAPAAARREMTPALRDAAHLPPAAVRAPAAPAAPHACVPQRQRGIAVGVVIAALVLLAALAGVLAASMHDTLDYTNRERLKAEIMSQGELIKQKILKCGMDYPTGNNGDATSIDPALPHTDISNSTDLSTMVCPGSSKRVFDGSDGIFYPPPIKGCTPWVLNNSTTNSPASVWLGQWCTSQEGIAAIGDVINVLGAGEAQYATNAITNDTLVLLIHK